MTQGLSCPNKSHPLWKLMVAKYGEEEALYKWVLNGYEFEGLSRSNSTRIEDEFEDNKLSNYQTEEVILIPQDEPYKQLYKSNKDTLNLKQLEDDIEYTLSRIKENDFKHSYENILQAQLATYWLRMSDTNYSFIADGRSFYLTNKDDIIGRISIGDNGVIKSSKIADEYMSKGVGKLMYQAMSKSLQAMYNTPLESFKNFIPVEVEGQTRKYAEEAWNRWVKQGLAKDRGNKFVMLQDSEIEAKSDDIISKFADKLQSKFSIPYKIVNEGKGNGYFNFKDNTAYFVSGKANETTTIHEQFSHPFIQAIKQNNKELYDNLLTEAKSNQEIVDYVERVYNKDSQNVYEHELIARAIDLYVVDELDYEKNKGLIAAIVRFFKELSTALQELFSKDEISVQDINANTSPNSFPTSAVKSLYSWSNVPKSVCFPT